MSPRTLSPIVISGPVKELPIVLLLIEILSIHFRTRDSGNDGTFLMMGNARFTSSPVFFFFGGGGGGGVLTLIIA